MNKQLTFIILAGFFGAASATGIKPQPEPIPTTTIWSKPHAEAASSATAGAVAGAVSGSASGASVGDTTATGGAGGEAASSAYSGGSYSAINGGDTSSRFLSLPQPVWTSVPTPFGCLVSESKAGAIGWNFASGSSSKQFSDAVCTTIRMAEAAYLHCQYLTAAYLNKRAFETMHPGEDGGFFLAANPENLNPVQCDALKRPVLRMSPTVATAPAPTPSVTSINVTQQQPQECPKPQTRIVYREKPAQKPCVNCCK